MDSVDSEAVPYASAVGGARADVERLLAAFLADPWRGRTDNQNHALAYMVKQQTQQDEQTLRELQEHKSRRALLEEDVETMASCRFQNCFSNRLNSVSSFHCRRAFLLLSRN
jgi:hypothetical protein